MKQTNSAISMLIKAYKSVLTNCFRKEFLLMGGVIAFSCGTALAADLTFSGNADIHGNPNLSVPYTEYENIDIRVTGVDNGYYQTTTEGLVISDKIFTATKSVNIVNTAQHPNIDNNGGVYAKDNATINFTDMESVYIAAISGQEGRNDNTTITAKGVGETNTVNVSGKKVQLIGSLDVTGLFSTNTINIDLKGQDSFWYGSAIGESSSILGTNSVNVTLSDGASWIFNASGSAFNRDGELSNLTLNNGVVILNDDIIWEKYNSTVIKGTDYVLADYRVKDANYQTVEIGNLKGSGGIFQMDIDWLSNQGATAETDKSDFIYIENVEDGSQQYVDFNLADAHLDEMNAGDKLYFAEVQTGSTTFTTAADNYVQNSADEVRTFVYGTQSELSENDYTLWYLTKSLGGTNEYVPLMKGATFASYSLATEMDRFNDRRGESRYVSNTNDGLWVRYSYTDLGWDNAFDMNKHMVQLGYDRQFAEAYGKHYFGIAFDSTNADIDIDGVSGDNDAQRYAMNLYYTWLAYNGVYADFVIKGGVIDSDYDVKNTSGAKIGGDLEQWYYGVSAETGYKYTFANQIFVEPQAQLQLLHLEGDRFTSDGGVKAKIDDTNSLIGRVGFRAGYDFSLSRDLPDSSVYIKADVMHEFNGDKEFKLQGRTTSYADEFSGTDTWYDAGIGIDLSVTDNTKLWVDAEHIFGADYDSTWQVNAGARYEF